MHKFRYVLPGWMADHRRHWGIYWHQIEVSLFDYTVSTWIPHNISVLRSKLASIHLDTQKLHSNGSAPLSQRVNNHPGGASGPNILRYFHHSPPWLFQRTPRLLVCACSSPHSIKYVNQFATLRKDLQGPVALGFLSSILTIAFSGFRYYSIGRPQFSGSKITMLFLAGDLLLFLCYVGTAGLLLKPKTIDTSKSYLDSPPMGSWYSATVLSVITAWVHSECWSHL